MDSGLTPPDRASHGPLTCPGMTGAENWRGARRVAPDPSCFSYQPACKPGSVGHRRLAQAIRDGHSSGTMFAHCLEQPTRTAGLTLPLRCFRFREQPRCRPYSVLLPVWFAMPPSLPKDAVRSYRTFSPLLAVAAYAAMAQQASRACRAEAPKGRRRAVRSLWHFPWGHTRLRGQNPAGCYPAPYVDGARTFLPRSLSAIAGAAVRPTDALGMGALHHKIKPSFRDAPAWAQARNP
jgi:hypothetical protein